MKPTSPWSVKGVDPEAREAAKLAARKCGLPLGAWLSQTIRAVAAQQLKFNGSVPPSELGDMTGGTGPAPSGAPGEDPGPRPPAPTTEAVLESINRLAAKIEENETRTAEAIAPIADKVKELSEQIDEVKDHAAIESSPIERAVSRLSERLDQIEQGPRHRERDRRRGLLSRLFSD